MVRPHPHWALEWEWDRSFGTFGRLVRVPGPRWRVEVCGPRCRYTSIGKRNVLAEAALLLIQHLLAVEVEALLLKQEGQLNRAAVRICIGIANMNFTELEKRVLGWSK